MRNFESRKGQGSKNKTVFKDICLLKLPSLGYWTGHGFVFDIDVEET